MPAMTSVSSASPVRSIFFLPLSTSTTRLERFWIFVSTSADTIPPVRPSAFFHFLMSFSRIVTLGETTVTLSGPTIVARQLVAGEAAFAVIGVASD